ncbi:MAG TPA: MnhB domain-containing protein [Terriglobia bacterium]|nr:MnhB domain-containing protein [Terriglobia bacterium]
MSRRLRSLLFVPLAAAFLVLFLSATVGIPAVGNYRGPYGDVLNAVAVKERHSTDVVTAVNFDYRGFDTLGEESILFISVIGATVLLRQRPDEIKEKDKEEDDGRHVPKISDAVRLLCLALAAPAVLFGIYVVTHGQLTPGGGFQGGVILATVPLLVYLAGDLRTFQKTTPRILPEIAECIGVGGYILIGVAGLIWGGSFLQNVVPLGPEDAKVYSGGTIPLISVATGLAVTGGFVLLLIAFLEETLQLRLKGKRGSK